MSFTRGFPMSSCFDFPHRCPAGIVGFGFSVFGHRFVGAHTHVVGFSACESGDGCGGRRCLGNLFCLCAGEALAGGIRELIPGDLRLTAEPSGGKAAGAGAQTAPLGGTRCDREGGGERAGIGRAAEFDRDRMRSDFVSVFGIADRVVRCGDACAGAVGDVRPRAGLRGA